ncbi:hypothetical protein CVT24_013138, partial [Panaeolus cyanescens]
LRHLCPNHHPPPRHLPPLEYPRSDYLFINIGNDRPNVAIVVRALEHSQESYRDLDFIIISKNGINKPKDIPSTMLYVDSVAKGPEIIDYLVALLPLHLRDLGLVRPFSAGFPLEYRTEVLAQFKNGAIRVLVCTDAAGMGCNLPAVDVVVQWKLPQTLSAFVQRAGRAARSPSQSGLAVLLVERVAYGLDSNAVEGVSGARKESYGKKGSKKKNDRGESTKKQQKKSELDSRTRKEINELAIARGVNRGSHSGKGDGLTKPLEIEPNPNASDEGLLALVQTTCCRRLVITKSYRNIVSNKPIICCDICDPSLLDRTRPGPPLQKARQTSVKKRATCDALKWAILEWRTRIHNCDFLHTIHGPPAILPDSVVLSISSIGVVTEDILDRMLGDSWALYSRYKTELLTIVQQIPSDAFTDQAHPASGLNLRGKGVKRKAGEQVVEKGSTGNGRGDGGEKQGTQPLSNPELPPSSHTSSSLPPRSTPSSQSTSSNQPATQVSTSLPKTTLFPASLSTPATPRPPQNSYPVMSYMYPTTPTPMTRYPYSTNITPYAGVQGAPYATYQYSSPAFPSGSIPSLYQWPYFQSYRAVPPISSSMTTTFGMTQVYSTPARPPSDLGAVVPSGRPSSPETAPLSSPTTTISSKK